jgi:hypothetical protein
MNIGYGIVATDGREEYLDKTIKSLANQELVKVYKDLEKGHLPNHIASMKKIYESNDWAMLMQDDILASKNWIKLVDFVATQFEYPIVSFYSALGQASNQETINKGYFFTSNWINEQAMLIRKDLYNDFLNWLNNGESKKIHRCHDGYMSEYLKAKKIKVMIIAPSVFQHVGIKSSLNHLWKTFGKERMAKSFMGEDFDCYQDFINKISK